jgi:hypothetical protein
MRRLSVAVVVCFFLHISAFGQPVNKLTNAYQKNAP